jgi:hypothetical protein
MSDLTEHELKLINAVLSEVEPQDEYQPTQQQQSTNESLNQLVNELSSYLKQQKSKKSNKLLSIYNHLVQQLQTIATCESCTLETKLKATQAIIRLPIELWTAVFSQYSEYNPQIVHNASVFPEWLLTALIGSLQELLESPTEYIQEITRVLRAIKVVAQLLLVSSEKSKMKFNSLFALYPLHAEFINVINYVSALSKKNIDNSAFMTIAEENISLWLKFLKNQLEIKSHNTDYDGVEANNFVFVCKSIFKLIKYPALNTEAWETLKALTLENKSHIQIIQRISSVDKPMMNIPHMLLAKLLKESNILFQKCLTYVSGENVSGLKGFKKLQYYMDRLTSILSNYSEQVVSQGQQNAFTLLLSAVKYSTLIPIMYCEKRKQSEINTTLLQSMHQSTYQIITKASAALKTLLTNGNDAAVVTYIQTIVLAERKDVYESSAQVFLIAFILSKLDGLQEHVELQLFKSIFSILPHCHAIMMQHTQSASSYRSLYAMTDNFLAQYYVKISKKKKLNSQIQSTLWTVVFDLQKSPLSRQFALDSICFYFAMSEKQDSNSCSPWINVCNSLVESYGNNLFMNSDGYVDDYDWILWKQSVQPLVERFGFIVSDSHKFIPSGTVDGKYIAEVAVLPRSLVHHYLSISTDNLEQVYDKCIEVVQSELSKEKIVEGTLLASLLVLGNYLSYVTCSDDISEAKIRSIITQLLAYKHTGTTSYRITLEVINLLSVVISIARRRISSDKSWPDKIITESIQLLDSLFASNNSNAAIRVAISNFVSNQCIKQPTADITNRLERLLSKVLVVPATSGNSSNKMEWVSFQNGIESIISLGKASGKSFKLKEILPIDSTPFVSSYYSSKESSTNTPSIFLDVATVNQFDNEQLITQRENRVCLKRKREYEEFDKRQKKRKLSKESGVNVSAIDNTTQMLKDLLSQIETMSSDEQKQLMNSIKPLALACQQVTNRMNAEQKKNAKK